jgi:thiamine-monophosphate kinase
MLVGIGDDASVARAGGELCAGSIDTMVEGVHFRLGEGWADPAEVGHRALAGALSDIAAVGAAPGEAYISLGLPAGFGEDEALELALGADALAVATGTAIAGGDVVSAPVLFVSVAVTGWLGAGERPLTREGASAGDLVGVTGELGAAAAALATMDGRAPRAPGADAAVERARRPVPRLAEGRALSAAGASAAIDVSDGLAADAEQLARASAVSLTLEADLLPLAPGVAGVAERIGVTAPALAAAGGEDYELCFCAEPGRRDAVESALREAGGAGVTWIGQAREGLPGARLLDRRGDVVRAEGYEHRW